MSDQAYQELPPMWDHQVEDLPLLLGGSAALWWEPRMGKTRAACEALRLLEAEDRIDGVIVLCPVQAKEVWRHWFKLMLPHWQVRMASGLVPPTDLDQDFDAVIINPDLLVSQARNGRGFAGWSGCLIDWIQGAEPGTQARWTFKGRGSRRVAVIEDESQIYFCQPTSKRYKAAAHICSLADRVWQTTGTYYEASALDAHHQLRHLGTSYPFYWWKSEQFGDRYCDRKKNPHKGREVTGRRKDGTTYTYRAGGWDYRGIKDEDRLIGALTCVSRRKRAGELAPRIEGWAEGPAQQVDLHRDDLERLRTELIPYKVERVMDYLEVVDVRPIVIFGWHRDFTQAISQRLTCPLIWGGTDEGQREKIRTEFQAGRHPVVVLNMRAAGFASEWSRADHTIFGELDWRATLHRQAEDRVQLPGKTGVVHHYVLCADTVEEEIWDKILMKGRAMDRLDLAAERLAQIRTDRS